MGRIYRTDGSVVDVKPKDGDKFSLEELQEYVGGYIEGVAMLDGKMAFVNEEGKLKGLPVNIKATMLSALYPHDVIVGDVLVCDDDEVE